MHNTVSRGSSWLSTTHAHRQTCTHTYTHADVHTGTHVYTRAPHTHTQLYFIGPHHLSLMWAPRGSQVRRDITVQKKILNLISGLDSDEELGLLCHHTSYLGDCLGLFVGSPSSVTFSFCFIVCTSAWLWKHGGLGTHRVTCPGHCVSGMLSRFWDSLRRGPSPWFCESVMSSPNAVLSRPASSSGISWDVDRRKIGSSKSSVCSLFPRL